MINLSQHAQHRAQQRGITTSMIETIFDNADILVDTSQRVPVALDSMMKHPHDLKRSETGLLRMFALAPKTPGKPRFEARWDDGSPGNRNRADVDFDIEDVSKEIKRDFKRKAGGYCGHHTDKSPDQDNRVYEIEISTPQGTVFKGVIKFNVTYSVGVTEAASARVNVDDASAVLLSLQHLGALVGND